MVFFPHWAHADSSFVGVSVVSRLSYVPYKGTYVPYDGTFGMPDQGQMLDVWGGIQQMSTLR
jgi:hypothetical protein